MTTQELYTKLIAGEITEQKFLYETRRDQNLPFVTSLNNFKDTVQILKNKGIISEKAAKEATGKQEVEIIAKTIDMVNPYEYSRGMDMELGVENEAVGNSDITEDDVLKAQKKVLKNLTKDPNYYSKKRIASMGDSEYEIEVNAKSIKALEKQKGKIIREGKDTITYDPNIHDDVIENLFMYEKDEYKVIKPGMIKFMDPDEAYNAANDLNDLDTPVKLAEHGQYADRVSDVNADSTPLNEDDIEELGRTRDAIYEKYAKKYGVDVDELKDRLEAYKLEKEGVTYAGKDSVDDFKKDPKYTSLSQSGKQDAEAKLRQGNTVSVG